LTDASYDLTTLDSVDIFNLLCIPPDTLTGDTGAAVYSAAMTYCAGRRAILIVDPPNSKWKGKDPSALNVTDLGLSGTAARNAAVYYPRIVQPNPLRGSQLEEFVPCGVIAGIIARTDTERGVWKAPAGVDASLTGVQSLQLKLTDAASGFLNPQGINCLRSLPVTGHVVWGARTLRGSDLLGDDYKYLPVRRLALFIEESIFRGTQWAVFEPNDEPLWSQIRLNIGSFMQGLFRQSAFQGQSPREAYFVKCDKETTTQADINSGIVNITVGFAPLKPAEFVVIRFQQMAGQTAT
jgi:phage tail sheath protein FI